MTNGVIIAQIVQYIYHNLITSYFQIVIQILVQEFNTINQLQLNFMQVVTQLNQSLVETVPLYGQALNYAQLQYNQSLESLNKIIAASTDRVSKARKASNSITSQAVCLLCQSADELLELIEDRLKMEIGETQEKDKTKRLMKILNQLKDTYLMGSVRRVCEYNNGLIIQGKVLGEKYIVPLIITLKATIAVSRQILMEALAERLGQLKMTYEVSKDTITMLFAGEFEEEKILSRVSSNIDSFKQFTVSFVKKGMEIKISRQDLQQNFTLVSDKLSEIVKGVSEKSVEQWTEAKSKTINLYNSVLARIKEKEIQIKTEYSEGARKTVGQPIKEE